MSKISKTFQILKNMGLHYVVFRISFEIKKRLGILRVSYPTNPTYKTFIDLESWKKLDRLFFFNSKEALDFPKERNKELELEAKGILNGEYIFFSSTSYHLGKEYDWVTNPDSGHRYDRTQHWINITDYSNSAGDIKYVWEKSRFTYLNTLIRYDYHFDIDQSIFVFSEIENWIDNNPINCGPNYKCSQEITIRCFNWIFALYYYKNSPSLTNAIFKKIVHVLYWQIKHVYANIKFSRIAVRNNHAISECLGIYTVGLLFPFFPESKKWIHYGKKWFEEEIAYQIYDDGTFLQFSLNYHRVVIQLLTWAIELNKLNDRPFKEIVYSRAISSLNFLYTCLNKKNGMLPNYGANDGALFFKLGVQKFRDYRPQLEALKYSLGLNCSEFKTEDKYWFGFKRTFLGENLVGQVDTESTSRIAEFKVGGYYTIRDIDESLTFIRCGNHNDRPSQADNLHLDIWVSGENILRDAGSYKYNTNERDLKYFFGTKSHNTVLLGQNDQMLKGERFIWYYWTQALDGSLNEEHEGYVFKGRINAFKHINGSITHTRIIKKIKGIYKWEVQDILKHNTDLPINQCWHPSEFFLKYFDISAKTLSGGIIEPLIEDGYYSSLYGEKIKCKQITFSSMEKCIITVITTKK